MTMTTSAKARHLFGKRAHPFWKKLGISFKTAFERCSNGVRITSKIEAINPAKMDSIDYFLKVPTVNKCHPSRTQRTKEEPMIIITQSIGFNPSTLKNCCKPGNSTIAI